MPPRGRPPHCKAKDAIIGRDGDTASSTEDDSNHNENEAPFEEENDTTEDNGQDEREAEPSLVQTMKSFFLQLAKEVQEQGMQGQHTGGSYNNITSKVVKQFKDYAPPRFNGRDGSLVMEEWIRTLERIFEHIDCSSTQKVSCAVFQLREDAGHWWESVARTMTVEERANLTWEKFKDLVTNRYFPRSYRTQKQTEFLTLTQGNCTVVEYEVQFNQLSRFVPHLVDTDEKKARKFEEGLRPELAGILMGLRLPTYAEVIERAQAISIGLKLENTTARSHQSSHKRNWENRSNESRIL